MRTAVALGVILAATLVACGPAGRGDDFGGGGDDDGSGSGSGMGSNMDGCSDAAKLVYVVDENNKFSQFNPSTKTFTDIGTLSCPAGSATPFSMGVNRNAVAWVLYSNGQLFQVDTSSLNCTASSWTTQQGLQQFGMGFSANQAGSTEDTLFVAGGSSVNPLSNPTSKLATLDTSTFSATAVGTVTGWPELTGTGNAELWGWFPDESSPRIEQIDKTTGAAVKTYQLSQLAGTPAAWAFAFWGGDFWIFLMRADIIGPTDLNTKVYQIDGMTGALKSTTDAPGRTIVGAGVSTCAPVVIL